MNAKGFTQELDKAINQFQQKCERYGTIIEDGVDISFGKGYLSLYAEVEDDDEDVVSCSQEFEFDEDNKSSLVALFFETNL